MAYRNERVGEGATSLVWATARASSPQFFSSSGNPDRPLGISPYPTYSLRLTTDKRTTYQFLRIDGLAGRGVGCGHEEWGLAYYCRSPGRAAAWDGALCQLFSVCGDAMRKPDRFEKMVMKAESVVDVSGYGIDTCAVYSREVIKLLRRQHNAYVRMVKKMPCLYADGRGQLLDAFTRYKKGTQ